MVCLFFLNRIIRWNIYRLEV